jgi:ketosteroid isomerase-like protein
MANATVGQAFIAAFGSGDAETALGQLHDDVQVSEPASLPIGGEYAGKAAFVGFLAGVAATYDAKIHRAEVMGAGDMAVARLDLTRTAHRTGASLDTQFCELHTRRWRQDHLHQRLPEGHQGPLRAHRRQRDAASVIGQLG